MASMLRGPGAGQSDRPPSWLTRSLLFVAALTLFAMMALTFADVIGRYFLNAPIAGAHEVISIMLGLIVFAALPVVTRNRGHITLGILEKFFQGRPRYMQRLGILLGTLATVAFISWLLWDQAETMRRGGHLSLYLNMPMAPIVYVLSGLTALAVPLLIGVIWHYLKEGGDSESK